MTSLHPSTFRRGLVPALLAATLVAFGAAPAAATVYTIDILFDDRKENGNCGLREALRAADRDVAVDACPAGGTDDTIMLSSGTYDFRGQEALAGSGYLNIRSAAYNPLDVTVDLQGAGRFLALTGGGTYSVGGLTIANGDAGVGDGNGGAIRAVGVNLTIDNFRFVANAATSAGGALYFFADGFSFDRRGRLTLTRGTFLYNHVDGPSASGGAVHAYILGPYDDPSYLQALQFESNWVSASTRAEGGALYLRAVAVGHAVSCESCSFEGNVALATTGGADGAGAFIEGSTGMVDCRFVGNFAYTSDGSPATAALVARTRAEQVNLERLSVDSNSGVSASNTRDVFLDVEGGVLSLVDSRLTHGFGSGLEARASRGTLRLGHLTIAGYPGAGAAVRVLSTGQAVLQNSISVFNGGGNFNVLEGMVPQTTNFIGGDPLFVDAGGGNYRLAAGSPAIDAGWRSVVTYRPLDLDRHPRLAGGATDIGAYEFTPIYDCGPGGVYCIGIHP
jgi:hypothetical protein